MNEPTPPTPQPMGPSQPGVIAPWLLIVFIIVFLGGGGYLGWYFWNQSQIKTDKPTTIPTAATTTPTMTSATSTADWKTYTNTKYGYSLKIPKNYGTLDTFDSSYRSTISETDDLINLGSGSNAKSTIVLLSSKSTIADWLIQHNNDWAKSDINIGISKNIKAKNVIIGGVDTYHELNSVVLIELDGNLLEIAEQNNRPILDQILSTFQFTQ